MKMKTFALTLVLVLIGAIFAAGTTLLGMQVFRKDQASSPKSEFALFSSHHAPVVEFVEIKNVIIAPKSSDGAEHYLLVELVLQTDDAKKTKLTQQMEPAIRTTTVQLLSSMNYDEIRKMSIEQLNKALMKAYIQSFKHIGVLPPFKEVNISKLLFQ